MEINPVIVGEIGSFAHGLHNEDSDHDYIGIYLDPPESLIGLAAETGAVRDRDKPEGVKSEAGDSETTYYGLRKYAKLAAQGNPTVLTLLYTPNLTVPDHIGLQANRYMFLSKRLVDRHIGYADNMAARLTGQKAPRTNRPELIAKHGYDTKAAFHAIRLLMQGHEMLTTGYMQMPMQELRRDYLLSVRNGQVPKEQALEDIADWRGFIQAAEATTSLPEHPDYAKINRWLIRTHQDAWQRLGCAA
ncbi:nucleotidyltransferase [Mycobacterium phage Bromden]|uniref:Nucleotidyl transferase n=1 Tax=Mycobacterium phage Bromden TaxID=2283252 RepID=A0A345MBG9_9CAUD|nr:nucleotidyltransferase [Mycobacterium phage Bromden]AXH67840.1 nucleotidyl transferase [Mycobacterium phage Bromden]